MSVQEEYDFQKKFYEAFMIRLNDAEDRLRKFDLRLQKVEQENVDLKLSLDKARAAYKKIEVSNGFCHKVKE